MMNERWLGHLGCECLRMLVYTWDINNAALFQAMEAGSTLAERPIELASRDRIGHFVSLSIYLRFKIQAVGSWDSYGHF